MSQTLQRVVDCLVTTTRYPRELLAPDADLEHGLGIDSIKRMELLLALGEEFSIDLQTQQYDPAVRTVGDLASWLERLLGNEQPEQASPLVSTPNATSSNGQPQNGQPQNGQLPNGQSPNGQSPNGQSPNGQSPNGQSPNGQPQNGQSRNGQRSHRISPPHSMPRPHHLGPAGGASADTGKPLRGRVALVTGSGRGVGRTIARLLADRGAMVIVNSFHSREQGEATAQEIIDRGGEAVHIWGSVANPEHVDNMFDEVQHYGLDILVCNASDGRIGAFLELTPDDWDRAFRTNVAGHHQCAVRAAEIMRPRGGGSIVTMSAVGAHQHIDGLGSQGVVKAAVESLTRYLAVSLGGSGIRVNCVAGGPVYGELLDKFPEASAAQNHWESMTPDGELCNPIDLARVISFLVSEEARAINGAVWMADHGFSATAEGRRNGMAPLANQFHN